MNNFKLKIEKFEQQVNIDNKGNDVLIYSEYDKLDKHSINLRDYLSKEGIKTDIVPSTRKKGITSSYCDILVENVVFFIASSALQWAIGKYLDGLWDDSRKTIKERPHLFKKRDFFIVQYPICIYDKKNKKIAGMVYTGEIQEVISKIKSDFNVKW